MRNERRCVVAVALRREYHSLVINLFAGKARLEGYHRTELSLLKDPNPTLSQQTHFAEASYRRNASQT